MREQKKEQLFKAFLREKITNENAGLSNERIMNSVFDKYQIHEGDRPFCKNHILQRIKEQERECRRNYAEPRLLFEENPENRGFGPPR